ncbi:MAG: TOPRIM nucleotidyl transferase/hydrolase domain-containing protein [Conexivisphaera sp.]
MVHDRTILQSLFADCVILVEGRDEEYLLNWFMDRELLDVGDREVLVFSVDGKGNFRYYVNALENLGIPCVTYHDGEANGWRDNGPQGGGLLRDVGFGYSDLVKALCDPEEIAPGLGTDAEKSLGDVFRKAYSYVFHDNRSCRPNGDPCSDEVLNDCKPPKNNDGAPHRCCPKEPSMIGAFLEKLYEKRKDGGGSDPRFDSLRNKLNIAAIEDALKGSRRLRGAGPLGAASGTFTNQGGSKAEVHADIYRVSLKASRSRGIGGTAIAI